MDLSVGSDLVSESSACQPASALRRNAEGSAESNSSEERGQDRAFPSKFQIRTAKERQRLLVPIKCLKATNTSDDEKTDNVSKGSNSRRTEFLKARAPSPPSPDSSTEERTSRALNQDTELMTGGVTLEKPATSDGLTTRARGRTEGRGAHLINRSKSLDWRRSDRENENQTIVVRDTIDFQRLPRRHSESLEEKETSNRQKLREPASPSNSVLLRIRAYNAIGQGMQNSGVNISPMLSGNSSVRVGRMGLALERAKGGQSLPSRLKLKEIQDSTEDRKSPWRQSEHSSPKPDQAEVQPRSPLCGAKASEITGNQTILDRIGKLYGLTASEDSVDANSRDYSRSKRYSAPVGDWFSSSDVIDSNLHSNHRQSTNDSTLGLQPTSSFCQRRSVSHDTESSGTFFTKDENDCTSVLPNRNVRKDSSSNIAVSSVSSWSKDRPPGKDSTRLLTGNSEWNSKTQMRDSMVQRTHSLDRARSRNSATALSPAYGTSYSACDSSTPGKAGLYTRQESIRNETDRQGEKTNYNSPYVKVLGISPGKQLHSPQESILFAKDVIGQAKPQFSQSVTADSERCKGNEDVFERGSLTVPRIKREALQEKVQSLDSVRSTIHKFEALAQQNQGLSQSHCPRRSFSVPEQPRLVAGVSKSNSDKSLSEWKGSWNAKNMTENFFGKVCDEVDSNLYLSGPVQTTSKENPTMKNECRASYRDESGITANLQGKPAPEGSKEIKCNDKNDTNPIIMNKHIDEPDFSKAIHPNLKDMEEKVQSDPNANNKPTGSTRISYLELKDVTVSQSKSSLDVNDEANRENQEIPPRTKDVKPFQTSESTSELPELDSSTSGKSALTPNITPSKSLSSPSRGSTPTQAITSATSDLNNIYSTRDEKVAAKISRWIAYERDGVNAATEHYNDDDEVTEREEDSDSGESSITITSNMSQSDHRSFSLSLADLCNLGGLDYPPSDGNGSGNEDNWMSRRSASLSSDISVLSSVTLLGTEELDCLLDDVRGLGDDALQNCEDVQVVVLHKEVGRGLGFTVAGGVDQNKPVTVHRVFPCGAAGQEGSIQEGDRVLSINGTALHNSAHWEALRTLRKARGRSMAVVVLSRGNITETRASVKDTVKKPVGNIAGSRVRVTLSKSTSDLGFSLEGGVGSSLGDRPLTVQRIFQGGPDGKVLPGDELLEVQGHSMEGIRRLEAWKLIKRLPPGPVEVLLHRPHLHH